MIINVKEKYKNDVIVDRVGVGKEKPCCDKLLSNENIGYEIGHLCIINVSDYGIDYCGEISFCPFCGEKIEYNVVEVLRYRSVKKEYQEVKTKHKTEWVLEGE